MEITLLVFDIQLDSPWSLAAPEVAEAVDRPLARDDRRRPFIPASSLAGSLKEHLGPDGHRLMGGAAEPSEGEEIPPSALRLLGTEVAAAATQLVRSTAIDRDRGAARQRTLRSTETGPADTTVRLYARYDDRPDMALLEALAAWRPAVGGGRTSGLGRAHLATLRWGTLDLADPNDLRTWLLDGGPRLFEAAATNKPPLADQTATPWLQTRWRIVDGLLTAGTADGATTMVWRRDDQPYIEGSSFKGMLRNRAEFILRSLGEAACDGTGPGCETCLACALFGSRGRRGRLSVRGTPIEQAQLERQAHVAIDRITGGAAAGRLFEDEVVVAGRFTLTIDALDGKIPPAGRRLVLQVLADLHDGLFGIGSRSTRGLGTVELEDPAVLAELNRPNQPAGSGGAG
jgi:CRISPR/Cas system CSM-associated protein Csm3 (group 7 of RAMP superfamily)